MRKHPCSTYALAWTLSLLVGVGVASAQEWDIPAEAISRQLASISVDGYPGADAVVVFDRREVVVEESGLSRTVQHTLSKALTPAGARELAVRVYGYDPLSAEIGVLRCRVFSALGTVREVDPKCSLDLPDPQSMIYWGSRHQLLPVGRIAPGDAVEIVTRRAGFTYALLAEGPAGESRFIPPMRGHFYDIVPFWSTHPVVEQRYRVTIPLEKKLQHQLFHGAAEVSDRIEDDARVVTVTLRDFTPLAAEPGMVAWSDVAPKLLLTTTRDWRAKAVWFYTTQEAARSFEVTPEIAKLAEKVTAGLTDEADKVSALTHWVAENIRYVGLHMGEGEGYTLHPAVMTLRDRGGVCKDKAGILVALLRAADLESYAAMTMAGERIEDIAADQFNHCVTVWRAADGSTTLLDPTWVPGVRELWSSREQQQQVLMGLPEGADLLTTPLSPPERHPLKVTVTSTLSEEGTLEGLLGLTSDGQSDAALRRAYRGRARPEWSEVDRQWIAALDPRAEVHDVSHTDPDDLARPFALSLRFRIPGYARRLSDGSLLMTPLVARHPVGEALHSDELSLSTAPVTRRFPARIGCTKLLTLQERLTLPPGSSVEGLPAPVQLDGNGSLEAAWAVDGTELAITETLAMRSRLIEPESWPELRAALDTFRALAATRLRIVPEGSKKDDAPGGAREDGASPSVRPSFKSAAGADAEYLLFRDRYVLREDGAIAHERELRLRVNSFLAIHRRYGESYVDFDPAFETIETLRHRTVLPGGAVVDAPPNAVVGDLPPAAYHNPLWAGLRRRVFIHTALEPGAVIELSWRVVRKAGAVPWLEVAESMAADIPIQERVVEVELPAGATLRGGIENARAAAGAAWLEPTRRSLPDGERWIWRRTDATAVPVEIGAPRRDAFLPVLRASTCPSPDALSGEIAARFDAALPVPPEASAAVRDAVAKESAWESRVLAGLEALPSALAPSALDPSSQNWRPRPLADVWQSGVATALELAVFQAAALAELDIPARTVLAGVPGRDVASCPTLVGFDRPLLEVKDPSGSWRLYEPRGEADDDPLEASLKTPILVPGGGFETPREAIWRRSVTIVGEIAADGAFSGSLSFVATGAATPHAALVRDADRWSVELVAGLVPGGKAKNARVTALGRLSSELECQIEGKLPAADPLGLVELATSPSAGCIDAELPVIVPEVRVSPVALPGPGVEELELTLTLPKGWNVAALPTEIAIRNDIGEVTVAAGAREDGAIHAVRRISLATSEVPADSAARAYALIAAWRNPAGRSLLLRPTAAEETR